MKLLTKWLLSAAALLAVAYLYSGVEIKSYSAALIAAVLIGLFAAALIEASWWIQGRVLGEPRVLWRAKDQVRKLARGESSGNRTATVSSSTTKG